MSGAITALSTKMEKWSIEAASGPHRRPSKSGSTGFIGSALVPDLIKAGHQVLGLTRSEAGAEKLRAAGAEVPHGNLEDLDSLRKGATDSDGVIHLAFSHDFSQFEKNAADERKAITALGEVLDG